MEEVAKPVHPTQGSLTPTNHAKHPKNEASKENVEHQHEEPTHTPFGKKMHQKKTRQLIGLISASRYAFPRDYDRRRSGRTPEKKRESAEKASALNEEINGEPLAIDHNGEIYREKEELE